MFKYGATQYRFTPGPQILLKAFSPYDKSLSSVAEAVIDTGAVMTCVPQRVIDEIGEGTLIYSNRIVQGVVGRGSSKKTYIVDLKIAKCDFPNIEVIVFDKEYALIGRDILNNFVVSFDGPNKIWRVEAKC